MAGRNWTRKSIEEMIDAYARKRMSGIGNSSSGIGGWYDRRGTDGKLEIEDGVYVSIGFDHDPIIGCLDFNPDLATYNSPAINLVAPAMAGGDLKGKNIIDIVNREVGTGRARPSIQFVAYCDGYDHVLTGGRSLIINTPAMISHGVEYSSGMDYFDEVPYENRKRIYFRPMQSPQTYGTSSNYVGKIYVGRVIYDQTVGAHDTVLFKLTGSALGDKGLYWQNEPVMGEHDEYLGYRSFVKPISGSLDDLQLIMRQSSVTSIYTEVPSTVIVLCCFWQKRDFYEGTDDKTIVDLFNYIASREFNIYPAGYPLNYKLVIQDYPI